MEMIQRMPPRAAAYPPPAAAIDPREFAGKRVLVTGGTQGAGAAMVRRMAAGGALVVSSARTAPPSDHPLSLFVQADLGTHDGVERLVRAVTERFGSLDILIHNLGGSSSSGGGFAALTDEMWQDEIALNLLAAVRLDRAFVPALIERGSGVILHVSSIQRRLPLYESTLAYAAAKAALSTYSKGLSKELGPRGVRVNSIAPGWIRTGAADAMVQRLAASAGIRRSGRPAKHHERPRRDSDRSPRVAGGGGRAGAFLASDRTCSLHGCEVVIDGGTTPTL